MKYKKQSLKKKHRRHRFSKKYTSAVTFQRGGGFMDVIAQLSTMEGRTNTCTAVHLTQPLVAVGDDAGTVTLWEINPSQPKKLALLTGLQIAVKCVEFHPSLPVVAAACSDKVLMWRFDQINREQEQQQEGGAVQQLEPSHTVCVFGLRSQEVVEQELRDMERNEVSCIAFHPQIVKHFNQNTSYIAVGVNNDAAPKNNRIIMYEFKIEPSSSERLHSLPLYFRTEIQGGKYPQNEKILLTSFSHDGALFAFVTKSLVDGTTVLKVINFKGPENRHEFAEYQIYHIRKKCDITCIRPYNRTDVGYHDGSFYKFPGPMRTHYFIIGCDDGSLMLINAVTIYLRHYKLTRVENVQTFREWNAGEAIECVAVHPSLPLFASGSRNAVQLWDVSVGEKKPLVVQPEVTPVISVGFNDKFFTACGSGHHGVRVYSCNANDYRGFKEELKKELQSGTEIAKYGTELVLAGRQGEPCSICGDPMNDPLLQQALRSGPADAQEVYLECGHKFHKDCIEPWINQRKPCPLCRVQGSLAQATPQRIGQGRQGLQDLQRQRGARFVAENLVDRSDRYQPRVPRVLDFGQPAAASSAPEVVAEHPASAVLTQEQLRAARLAYIERRRQEQQQQQLSSENSGGSIKNKYSRKKNMSKKLKFHRRYSKKI